MKYCNITGMLSQEALKYINDIINKCLEPKIKSPFQVFLVLITHVSQESAEHQIPVSLLLLQTK
jgi:hypothetical protein